MPSVKQLLGTSFAVNLNFLPKCACNAAKCSSVWDRPSYCCTPNFVASIPPKSCFKLAFYCRIHHQFNVCLCCSTDYAWHIVLVSKVNLKCCTIASLSHLTVFPRFLSSTFVSSAHDRVPQLSIQLLACWRYFKMSENPHFLS